MFIQQAKKLIFKGAVSKLWGWKEPKTTLFPAFWGNFLPDAKFILIYRCSWAVVDSLYRRGNDPIFHEPLVSLIARRKQEAPIINPMFLLGTQDNKKVNFNLILPKSSLDEPSLFYVKGLNSYRHSFIQLTFSEVLELYQKLEARAWSSGDRIDWAWQEQNVESTYRMWAFKERDSFQQQFHQAQEQIQQLTHERDSFQQQFHQAQEQLQETEKTLEKVRKELDSSHQQSSQIQKQLELLQKQYQETQQQLQENQDALQQSQQKSRDLEEQLASKQKEVIEIQCRLEETEEVMWQSQDLLNETEDSLEEYQKQVAELENELKQTQIQFEKTQTELNQLKFQQDLDQQELTDREREYHYLVWEGWCAYKKNDWETMVNYLQQSLEFTSLTRSQTIISWIELFSQYATQESKVLDINQFIDSEPWQTLIKRMRGVKRSRSSHR
ncbi:hypothetical protein PCC7418_1232 [Halothece sp. PCC 7418]|nr:hypothetical protein PCC7418_1232 [Halothece sp. PCC 7418]